MRQIGIFPAAGGLGSSTYTHLLALVPHENVTLIARDPSKIPNDYTDSGVTKRTASYESSASDLEAAFAGLDTLFLISYPSFVHDYRVKVQFPAIDAARRAGVKHIFYSSLAYARERDSTSKAEVMQAHLSTEKYLAKLAADDKAFSYTVIREGLYCESFPIYTSFLDLEDPGDGVIRIPHDGSGPGVAWAKQDELGEASAKMIARQATKPEGSRYENQIVLLTGSKVWTIKETVQALGRVIGKELKLEKVGVEEYARQKGNVEKFGKPESGMAQSWSSAFEAIKDGECAVVSPALRDILGREPEGFEETLRSGVKFQDKA